MRCRVVLLHIYDHVFDILAICRDLFLNLLPLLILRQVLHRVIVLASRVMNLLTLE